METERGLSISKQITHASGNRWSNYHHCLILSDNPLKPQSRNTRNEERQQFTRCPIFKFYVAGLEKLIYGSTEHTKAFCSFGMRGWSFPFEHAKGYGTNGGKFRCDHRVCDCLCVEYGVWSYGEDIKMASERKSLVSRLCLDNSL
ncbi:hypothetical protein TNCT_90931 [Trichonephila clavata]|uniref:Uncharacterized protein n=1 Tax=Trichonephila clavata TaxID=2740835 RepID=A0A8X6HUE3_TRICU|nr:hypothetical protein TNCT_90931 [Trichonephila clavata]